MGYIEQMYGHRGPEFISGFLAAMDTYSVWHNGKRYIGSPETELKSAMREAVSELCEVPADYEDDILSYF